jgi:hypothetical protein
MELFRFSVIRAAARSTATAVALERPPTPSPPPPSITSAGETTTSSFQDQLRDTVQKNVTDKVDTKKIWQNLEPIAFDFITKHAQAILTNSLWAKLQDFLKIIRETIQKSPLDITSDAIAKQFSDLKAQPGFPDYHYDVSDLFLALLIVRRGGPTRLDANIRSLKLWTSTELLSNNPALGDLADLIRIIEVIKAGPDALVPPGTDNAAAWKVRTAYKVGDLVSFNRKTYRCIEAHTSQSDWTPDATPALWQAATTQDSGTAIQAAFDSAMKKTLLFPPALFSPLQKPLQGVGFRELHVVKQHIRRYELKEIGQIENVLKGESRAHTQKHTLSNERDITVQTQTTTETDKELTTNDHVDIKNEAQNQVKEDTRVDAGVHAQYDGGSFHLQTDLTVSYDKSTDQSKTFSSDVAKDVTQKAVSKVTQQVTQIQTTKIIETFEDTQSQSFDNKAGTDHISGVYQWVEKVYLSQVFNLGRHMLLDIMVPEPGAALLAAAAVITGDQKPPVPPDPLGSIKVDSKTNLPILDSDGHKQLDKPLTPGQLSDNSGSSDYYGNWIAKFQVTGVEPPPPLYLSVAKSIAQKKGDDIGQVVANDTIQVEDGYSANAINVVATWLHDVPTVGGAPSMVDVTVGGQSFHFGEDQGDYKTRWGNEYLGTKKYEYTVPPGSKSAEQGQLPVTITAVWVENAGVDIEVICKRTDDRALAKWQLATYEKIVAAWQRLEADYESKLADFHSQIQSTGPLGGIDPDANRLIERTELKRQCIAIMDNANETVRGVDPGVAVQDSPDPDPKNDNSPYKPVLPEPNLAKSQEVGATVRWFEQAFEWENIAYVSYPYFWGRRATWIERLNLKNDDPLFVNFLQAGYTRVLVPVRLGFELAVQVYLNTGLPWLGGDIPPVGDKTQNPLYLDIAEEIKALTGGGEPNETETPVGEAWEYTLPTTLLKLRNDDALPEWHRIGPDGGEDETNYPSDQPDGQWSWKDGAPSNKGRRETLDTPKTPASGSHAST